MSTRVLGADVSHWQLNIDWEKLANSGIKFVIIKCTDGTSGIDSKFSYNWPQSSGKNLARGTYHYFRSSLSPKDQARHYFETLQSAGYPGDFRPILDVEQRPLNASGTKLCLQEIGRLFSKQPIIYTAPGIWNTLGSLSWAKDYDLWVAQYPYTSWSEHVIPSVQTKQPILPKGWNTWKMWQFTSYAPGPAFGAASNGIDLDFFNGDLHDLVVFLGKNPFQEGETRILDVSEAYIRALNSRNAGEVVKLYTLTGVHVTPLRTIMGSVAISDWYQALFQEFAPGAEVKLLGYSGTGNSRIIQWKVIGKSGAEINGNDTLGLIEGKIAYHFCVYS